MKKPMVKHFTITGKFRVLAETVEEAEAAFAKLTVWDLADEGELETSDWEEEVTE